MKILLLGDTCVQEGISFDSEFNKLIEEVDMTFLNFEGYFGEIRSDNLAVNEKKFFKIAKKLKVKAVSLANNHVNDIKNGLSNTKKILLKNEIGYFGTEEKPSYVTNGTVIIGAIWKLTGGNQNSLKKFTFNTDSITKEIKNCDEKIKIFYPHWGVELETLPHPWQVKESEKLIDNGFDLICGHHTHLTSIKKRRNEKSIIFSLGNFIMKKNELTYYYPEESSCGESIIYDTESKKVEVILFKLNSETNEIILTERKGINYNEMNFENYKEYFKENRKKKKLPIFTENYFTNYLKSFINLALINFFKLKIGRLIWKCLKKIIKKKK